MRITGGRYCGRIVRCPPGEIRPTMDRMRESMFSILGSLEGLSFLDLFAGSAVVGLEALSRGAKQVLWVEKDWKKRAQIQENLKIALDDPEFQQEKENQSRTRFRTRLIFRPVESVLKKRLLSYDIVHLDPPFAMLDKKNLLIQAEKAGQPALGGSLMIHHPAQEKLPEETAGLRRYDYRHYGHSHLSFYTTK